MVDSEPRRPLTPEVADDVGAGFGVLGDNHPHTQQEQTTLSAGGYRGDDLEYRSRHGGGERRGYEGDGKGRVRQVEDDPHGNAAMALTALSSGVRDLERDTSHSEFQGFARQQALTKRGVEKPLTEKEGGRMTPSYSERPLRDAQETFTEATMRAEVGSTQEHQQKQQQQQGTTQPLALHLPLSAAMTPSSSSSALNTLTLTASEPTSPNFAQEETASRDALITLQEQCAPHVPGKRMQSLSHMLKDRLSLASLRAERGPDRVDMYMSQQRMSREELKQSTRRDDHQQYHGYHDKSSSSHRDEFSVHSSGLLRDRPRTPPVFSIALQQGHDRSDGMRPQQWEFSNDGRSQQHQQDFQKCAQLHLQQQQQVQQQHHLAQNSSSIRNNRGHSHWMAQISPSSVRDSIVVKPKRKYTKKSSLLPQAMAENRDQVDFQSKQESNALLYSDRGLILKTQIPKKGRPISKHSTTSSQSTPTLTSLGILPANHHYFTKAGTMSSSSTSSAMSGLVDAAARYPSDSALSNHISSPQGAHPPQLSDQRGPVMSPTDRRPGRPPSSSSLPRHAHSQSYSSGSSMPFPPSQPGQAQPLPSPTPHEIDFHSAQYKGRQTSQELDVNRVSAYRDQSPTLSVATTASSQKLSCRLGQLPEYRTSSTSHRCYVSSPIEQEFFREELEYRDEEEDSRYPGRRRRTVDAPSAIAPRSFAEGVSAQMNTLKRSSSGMQKSLSMDGYHSRPSNNRRRRSVGGVSVGGVSVDREGEHGLMGYGTDGQFEDVNEEVGSSFFDEEFGDSMIDARSRKRISGSDLDYWGVDGIGIGTTDGGSVQRRVNQQRSNKTWHGATLESERRRPRSLVLPRGGGEPGLTWTKMLDLKSGSGSGPRSGAGSMMGALLGRRHLDTDGGEIDCHEMMIMTPAIAPGPSSQPQPLPAAPTSSSSSLMMLGGTRGKGCGGRLMHSHARSLDVSFSAPSQRGDHRGHRPLSPSSPEHPSRPDVYSSEEVLLPEQQQRTLTPDPRVCTSSSSSLNSLPFGDALFSDSDQTMFNMDTRGVPSGTDHRGYDLETAPLITRADILALEMSGTRSTPSDIGSERGRRGSSRGHHHLKAVATKRSTATTSKRGPGPHLKKHQILQQQLYQLQRDQEEMDLQMAMQLQQRRMQQQHLKQEQQEKQLQKQLKQQRQQQRKPSHLQRHQHSQSLQLEHEFSPHGFHHQQQQQQQSQRPLHLEQQQQQPRPGRPTKQRVLLRSESALAVLHGRHSPVLESTLSQSQTQPSFSQSTTTSISTSTSAAQLSSRRRQDQQQPTLLRPVSLPSLTDDTDSNINGTGGAGGMDSGSSPPYLMNHPPPGQPLFRSLYAPYLVSPSSLVSIASNASSSTGTTGTSDTFVNTGRGRGGRGGGDEDEGDDRAGDCEGSRRLSPVKSPHISYSTTPPLTTGSQMFTHPYSHRDSQGYPSHPQSYQSHHQHQQHPQQGHHHHHHHPYQRSPHHSTNTSSISSIASLHQDNLSTASTLSKRSSHLSGTISRSSSRGGMSTSSSTTTFVHSSTSQSSLHQHQYQHYQQHRHSFSLPSLHSYYQSSTASSSPTSPQHPLDQHQQHQKQQRMLNNPIQQNDLVRPPIQRIVSHEALPPLPPHKHTSSTTISQDPTPVPQLPILGPGGQLSTTPTTTNTINEDSVERLLVHTPLGNV